MEGQDESSGLQSNMAATAGPQLTSPFFTLLPPEVRQMIYAQVWRHSRTHRDARDQSQERCLKYHIIKQKSGGYAHSPCVVSDQTAPDIRVQKLAELPERGPDNDVWADRIASAWAIHWPCEELYNRHAPQRRPSKTSFMATLLTCKLMYLECFESIYSSLTFVFTDAAAAGSFIPLFPPATFRSLELAVCTPFTMRESYLAVMSSYTQHRPRAYLPFGADTDPWTGLCSALAACTALRSLSLWFDVTHLEGWTGRVWERLSFADLWDVRVVGGGGSGGGGKFVLALPELDARQVEERRRAYTEGNSYLVGEALEGAPFRVVRGARPFRWDERLGQRVWGMATIDPPPGT